MKYLEDLPLLNSHDSSMRWSCDKLNTLYSIWRRPMDTKLDQVLTYSERPQTLKLHDHLIMWPVLGHAIIWKVYNATLTKLMTIKPNRVLTYGKRFSMQILKSSPTFFFTIFLMAFSTYCNESRTILSAEMTVTSTLICCFLSITSNNFQ